MDKEELDSLLWRYQNDLCSDDERKKVEDWYEALDAGDADSFNSKDLENIQHSIRLRLPTELQPAKQIALKPWTVYSIGAAIAATGVALLLYVFYPNHNAVNQTLLEAADHLTLYINNSKKESSILLEDGSRVRLFPGSSLRYPKVFSGNKREVFLRGDGFFSITKDSTRAFYVFSEQVVVRVLGTSFLVRSQKEKSSVAVHSGKVVVFKNSSVPSPGNIGYDSTQIILSPNQQAVYRAASDSFHTTLIENPRQLAATNTRSSAALIFENNAVPKVLLALGEVYGINIHVSDEALLNCSFTGDLSETSFSLFDKLQMICQAIDASYKIEGVDIVVRGKGCY